MLSVAELVDLHGRSGFDVLCITDHVVRADDPWRSTFGLGFRSVEARMWDEYLAEIEREAARARRAYGLLVVPGIELTYNDLDPGEAAHAVAVGLRRFVSVDDGIAEAMKLAEEAGAAIIAAHPYDGEPTASPARVTRELLARRPPARARPSLRALQSHAALRVGRRDRPARGGNG